MYEMCVYTHYALYVYLVSLMTANKLSLIILQVSFFLVISMSRTRNSGPLLSISTFSFVFCFYSFRWIFKPLFSGFHQETSANP